MGEFNPPGPEANDTVRRVHNKFIIEHYITHHRQAEESDCVKLSRILFLCDAVGKMLLNGK